MLQLFNAITAPPPVETWLILFIKVTYLSRIKMLNDYKCNLL